MFEEKYFSETEVLGKAMKHVLEWQDSTANTKPPTFLPKYFSAIVTQTQSHENVFLCFSDASWNSSSCARGMGRICSYSAGTTFLQGSTSRTIVASTLVAEALALKAAMQADISLNIKDLICFSNSKGLINLITKNTYVIAPQGILHNISMLSKSLSSIFFKFVFRHCNMVVDSTTKNAMFSLQNSLLVKANSVT